MPTQRRQKLKCMAAPWSNLQKHKAATQFMRTAKNRLAVALLCLPVILGQRYNVSTLARADLPKLCCLDFVIEKSS